MENQVSEDHDTSINQDGYKYILNNEDQTAEVCVYSCDKSTIFFQRSVNYKSKEYIITKISRFSIIGRQNQYVQFAPDSEIRTIDNDVFKNLYIVSVTFSPHLTKICSNAFTDCHNLREVIFPENSELQVIESFAFINTAIESILIPSTVTELREGFICKNNKLSKIQVMPGNRYYKSYEDKYLFKKSNENEENFDVLILAAKDVKTVILPDYIKTISAYSFNECQQLQKVEVSKDSKLQTIEKFAFYESSIEFLSISSCFCNFEDGWNSSTPKLRKISIIGDNNRIKIYDDIFLIGKKDQEKEEFNFLFFYPRESNREKVTIPKFIEKIDSFAFESCQNIKEVEILEDSKLQIIGSYAFSNSSIEKVSFSSNVKQILKYSFAKCSNLQTVEFPKDSKLEKIDVLAFARSSIERFTIPPHLTEISKFTFYQCNKLKTVEILPNSDLKTICKEAFFESSIESITIPLHLTTICESAFKRCKKLKTVEILPNSDLRIIERSAFTESTIERFTIPPHLTEICESAFRDCKNLHEVITLPNSELRTIGFQAFSNSAIERFTIPPHLTEINKRAFYLCKKLQEVVIQPNSELKIIGKKSFFGSSIEKFTIPPHITKIDEDTFANCKHLQEVLTEENSELQTIEKHSFYYSTINKLVIPSNFVEFEEGWCNNTKNLTTITVMPGNTLYKTYEEKFLLGKSNPEKDEFDVLLFCQRNIEKVTIPEFIIIIKSHSFEYCSKLQEIDFSDKSKLQIIEKYAFDHCAFRKISIPSNVTTIGRNAFNDCRKLNRFVFDKNSELNLIEPFAFLSIPIVSFEVPMHLKILDLNVFTNCSCLEIIGINDDSELTKIIYNTYEEVIIFAPEKLHGCFEMEKVDDEDFYEY